MRTRDPKPRTQNPKPRIPLKSESENPKTETRKQTGALRDYLLDVTKVPGFVYQEVVSPQQSIYTQNLQPKSPSKPETRNRNPHSSNLLDVAKIPSFVYQEVSTLNLNHKPRTQDPKP